jgi:hypothetical protein
LLLEHATNEILRSTKTGEAPPSIQHHNDKNLHPKHFASKDSGLKTEPLITATKALVEVVTYLQGLDLSKPRDAASLLEKVTAIDTHFWVGHEGVLRSLKKELSPHAAGVFKDLLQATDNSESEADDIAKTAVRVIETGGNVLELDDESEAEVGEQGADVEMAAGGGDTAEGQDCISLL